MKTLFDYWNNGDISNLGSSQTTIMQAYRLADAGDRKLLETAFPNWFVKESAIPIPLLYKLKIMYTETNFKTKKEFKTAFLAGQTIRVFQPGGKVECKANGEVTVEGPHYPKPHRWYSSVEIKNSIVTKIIS